MVNVLVTGSSGFIGKHLVSKLQLAGFNLITISHDILENGNELRAIFANYNPRIVYNLQAYGNHSTQTDEYESIRSNIVYTHNLARIAKESKVEAFIQFGSSSEYGKKKEPMNEEDVLTPNTMYGATKASATEILHYLASDSFKVCVIRPFSIYGPGEADFRFIPTIIRAIRNQEVLTIDGNAAHDWTYIDDFINGVLVSTNVLIHGKDPFTIVNVGTGQQYTNREVYEFVRQIMRKKTKVKEAKLRSYDNRHWVADNTKLKNMGWIPQNDIILGLTHTISSYETH
jgi:nucleoside-diphosphate-sugar epimerase